MVKRKGNAFLVTMTLAELGCRCPSSIPIHLLHLGFFPYLVSSLFLSCLPPSLQLTLFPFFFFVMRSQCFPNWPQTFGPCDPPASAFQVVGTSGACTITRVGFILQCLLGEEHPGLLFSHVCLYICPFPVSVYIYFSMHPYWNPSMQTNRFPYLCTLCGHFSFFWLKNVSDFYPWI